MFETSRVRDQLRTIVLRRVLKPASYKVNSFISKDHVKGPCQRAVSKDHVKGPCQRTMSKGHAKGPCQRTMSKDHVKGPCQRTVSKDHAKGPCQRAVSKDHVKGPMHVDLWGPASTTDTTPDLWYEKEETHVTGERMETLGNPGPMTKAERSHLELAHEASWIVGVSADTRRMRRSGGGKRSKRRSCKSNDASKVFRSRTRRADGDTRWERVKTHTRSLRWGLFLRW
ncbi:hypothetical protein BDZ88DRAFT_337450 [Geranomyces variabilis]|nr:hypothetical protein BDZ88DRAFT_337450 [Geranomyces variabilis]